MQTLFIPFLPLLYVLTAHGLGGEHGTGAIHPRVSPDGLTIAVSYQGAIALFKPSGDSKINAITNGEGFDIQPAWSHDARRLAYINAPNFRQGQLRMLGMPGGESLKLPAEVRAQGRLYFHPDGRRLLGRFSQSGYPNSLAWLDLESGELKPVAMEGIIPGKLSTWRLPYALSPDGKIIALSTSLDVGGEQDGNNGPMHD